MRLRSLLFVPGDRPDRFAKALAAGADAVCLDLEDAVAPDAKAAARGHVGDALAAGMSAWVRPNPLDTAAGLADLLMLGDARPAGLLLPKSDSPDTVAVVARLLPGVPIVALVESARGLRRAAQIAATPGVVGLALGPVDLAAEFGAAFDAAGLHAARFALKAAAAEAGVVVLDGPALQVGDPAAVEAATREAAALGFDGKLAIHPAQLGPIHRGFAPEAEALARARALLARAEGEAGAFAFEGRMVDKPVIEAARRLVARATPDGAPSRPA